MYGLSKKELAVTVLLLIYILGPFNTPHELGHLLKTPIAGIVIFGVLIYLFYNSHIAIFVVYIFAVYELLDRLNKEDWEDMEEEREKFSNMIEQFEADLENDEEGELEGFANMIEPFADEPIEEDELDQLLGDQSKEGYEEDDDDADSTTSEAEQLAAESTGGTTGEGSPVDQTEVADAAAQVAAAAKQSTEQEAMSMAQSQLSGGAEVQEAFTQALSYNSLENEMINRLAPVGTGTTMKYKSTPYVSSASDLKGASLL